jgi:hypothetical protein
LTSSPSNLTSARLSRRKQYPGKYVSELSGWLAS